MRFLLNHVIQYIVSVENEKREICAIRKAIQQRNEKKRTMEIQFKIKHHILIYAVAGCRILEQ